MFYYFAIDSRLPSLTSNKFPRLRILCNRLTNVALVSLLAFGVVFGATLGFCLAQRVIG